MLWIKWIVMTSFCIFFIICAMLYGWGLTPQSWTKVILFYILANAMIPFTSYAMFLIDKKWRQNDST
jgi:hypothetical protein